MPRSLRQVYVSDDSLSNQVNLQLRDGNWNGLRFFLGPRSESLASKSLLGRRCRVRIVTFVWCSSVRKEKGDFLSAVLLLDNLHALSVRNGWPSYQLAPHLGSGSSLPLRIGEKIPNLEVPFYVRS